MTLNPKQRIDDRIAFRVDQSARDLQGQLGEIRTKLESVDSAANDVTERLNRGEDAVRQLSVELDVLQERIARLVDDVTDRMLKLERAVTQLERDADQSRGADGSPT